MKNPGGWVAAGIEAGLFVVGESDGEGSDSDVQELPPKKIKKERDLDSDAVKVIKTKTQSITLLTWSMKS